MPDYDERQLRMYRNENIADVLRGSRTDFDTAVNILRTTPGKQPLFPPGLTNDEVRAGFLAELDEWAEKADVDIAEAKQLAADVAEMRSLV